MCTGGAGVSEFEKVMFWKVLRYSEVLGNAKFVDGKPGRQDRPARLATHPDSGAQRNFLTVLPGKRMPGPWHSDS